MKLINAQASPYWDQMKQKFQLIDLNEHPYLEAIYNLTMFYAKQKDMFEGYPTLFQQLTEDAQRTGSSLSSYFCSAAALFCDEDVTTQLRYIADHMTEFPYASGYYRRPFRTKNEQVLLRYLFPKLGGLLIAKASQFSLQQHLSTPQYIQQFNHYIQDIIPDLIAYELDHQSHWIEVALKDIIYGENQTALLDRAMIVGILKSHQHHMYSIIGELLLAARLQEGLRQAICESLDFGTLQSTLHLLDVILEHNLVRFSSIVRALGTWTGMGLEAANQRVATQLLKDIRLSLTDAQQRDERLLSPNANHIYISLWATATIEEADLPHKISELMRKGATYQKIVAQYVLSNIQNNDLKHALANPYLSESDPELLYWILENYQGNYYMEWVSSVKDDVLHHKKALKFTRLPYLEDKAARSEQYFAFKDMLTRVSVPAKSAVSSVLPFTQYYYERDQIFKKMLLLTAYDYDQAWIAELIGYASEMSSEVRSVLMTYFTVDPSVKEQRSFVLQSLSDRSSTIRELVLDIMKQWTLTEEEIIAIEHILKLKSGALRQAAIGILLRQPSSLLDSSLQRLISSKAEPQRLAGLELLTIIHTSPNQYEQAEQWLALSQLISSPTPKEISLLQKLQQVEHLSLDNGFGLFDPKATDAWLLERPAVKLQNLYGMFTLSIDKAKQFLQGLDELVHQHREHQYTKTYYNGEHYTEVVGVSLSATTRKHANAMLHPSYERTAYIDHYPLADIWKQYFQQSNLSDEELLQLYFCMKLTSGDTTLSYYYDDFYTSGDNALSYSEARKTPLFDGERKAIAERYLPLDRILALQKLFEEPVYSNQIHSLLRDYFHDLHSETWFNLAEQAAHFLLQQHSQGLMEQANQAMVMILVDPWLSILMDKVADDDHFQRYFKLLFQYDYIYHDLKGRNYPNFNVNHIFRAYHNGIISHAEACKLLLARNEHDNMRTLTDQQHELISSSEKLQALRDQLMTILLDIELKRGDVPSSATKFTWEFKRIYGLDYFVNILVNLGGESFVRGYGYSYGSITKKDSFSRLLGVCYPLPEDTADRLEALLAHKGITEKRLLEAAMYAPQWIDLIAAYLGWDGLRSAVWYFHAHINESFSAEKETIVAHYSPITPQEFNDGAFDTNWFHQAYQEIGNERFLLLYDCAKYISGGANHRRAQLFTDAVLGRLELLSIQAQVAAKRNKDYLLAYSLIPLQQQQSELEDLQQRYDFIQLFLKQSKQFGAQRRASEGVSAGIALANLARTAGYADVTRLTWRMEANKLEQLSKLFTPYELEEGVQAWLDISTEGLAEIKCSSKGKALKSVPAKHKKSAYIAELKEAKTELTDQYKRSKRELERSMEQQTSFRQEELVTLLHNPVLRPLLSPLVFKAEEHLGFIIIQENQLCLHDVNGQCIVLETAIELTIAHPLHLKQSNQWSSYQEMLFIQQIRQPFKQVFRELYVMNADEQASRVQSMRYAGHQIQPQKAVALLRGRGWTVSYEEGLQKINYAENTIATLYAMADWFSPSEIEAPTLESVQFLDRKTYKPIPLEEISPISFSETMRDIDLVVSVAHAGGVDPEASLTTIELRRIIVEETVKLLKLDNVRVEGKYAFIGGKLGDYTVHLGSGIAAQQAYGTLHIIPVHSQHHGRIFLPFLDEDPRTAEITSKITLLAEDHLIKDPHILQQIGRK